MIVFFMFITNQFKSKNTVLYSVYTANSSKYTLRYFFIIRFKVKSNIPF